MEVCTGIFDISHVFRDKSDNNITRIFLRTWELLFAFLKSELVLLAFSISLVLQEFDRFS